MSTGSSDPSTMLVTDTHPIYSVTATEHSFVLGVIKLEKRSFVQMLATKTTGHALPAELIEIVVEHLHEHYWTSTNKSWERTDALWREGHPGLYWERYMTEDTLRTWCKLAESLNLTLAAREGPHAKHLTSSGSCNDTTRSPYVVHLARAGRYSHGGIGLRASESLGLPYQMLTGQFNAYREDSLRLARLRSGICGTSVNEGAGTACALFAGGKDGEHMEGSDRVERFLEVDGLEEEMRLWDAEAVRKCKAVLGLEMVGREGDEEGMRPRLRLVQSFMSDRRS